jgi:outer membrane receptor protein involved in Fe transport
VREAPPLLQTTIATVGSTVESKQITQLPLLGRNFTSLLMVLPGVSSAKAPRGGPFSVGGTGNNPNVFGQRWRNNNYTFDGVSNNEPLFNGVPMLPPPEALAEMKVESGMSSGAYGHASGANINVVSKSGTNALHGDLWEYLRNEKLDARSFFVPSLGPLRWNQFGAAAGGPLVIPKLVRRENGWYLFGYYEGIRIRRAANTSALVPTDRQLEGDFGGGVPIFNPFSTATDAAGVRTRQPFPDNRIPASMIHPSSKLIATELYPRANLAPGVIPGVNYFNPGSSRQDGDQWSARVDHQFGSRDNFFARYSDARNPRATIGLPTLPSEGYQRLSNVAVSDTHVFSPTFLITGRFGMQRLNYGDFTGGDLTIARRAGTLDAFPPFAGVEVIVPIAIAGYPGLSQGRAYYGPQYINSWIADASKTAGKHTIEFGGNVQRTTFKTNNQTGIQEQFTANQTSNYTSGTGFGLASFMLGIPESAGRVIGNTEGDMYGNTYSLYVQDNWRFSPRLTLNLGIRYDYASPMINRNGSGTFVYETGQYVWNMKNPITGEEANVSPGVIDPDRNNFQPRVGIAYQINPATVIRTSYGIFFDTFGINYAQTQQGNRGNWPFAFPQSVSGLNQGVPNAFITNPFPGEAAGSRTPLGCQQCLNAWHDTSRTPYVQQWTFSLQRQITPSLKAEAIYFGSHGVKISSQLIDNTALVPGPGPITARQKNPNFPAYVLNGYNSYHSNYNGLSLILQRRFAAGLSFSVNYTWSKSINFVDELSDNIQLFGMLPARVNVASGAVFRAGMCRIDSSPTIFGNCLGAPAAVLRISLLRGGRCPAS